MEDSFYVLQDVAVKARKKAKDEMKIDLNSIKSLKLNEIYKLQVLCCKEVYEKTARLQPKIVKLFISDNNYYIYIISVGPYIIDCSVDYYVPTNRFVFKISEYPLKVYNHAVLEKQGM